MPAEAPCKVLWAGCDHLEFCTSGSIGGVFPELRKAEGVKYFRVAVIRLVTVRSVHGNADHGPGWQTCAIFEREVLEYFAGKNHCE